MNEEDKKILEKQAMIWLKEHSSIDKKKLNYLDFCLKKKLFFPEFYEQIFIEDLISSIEPTGGFISVLINYSMYGVEQSVAQYQFKLALAHHPLVEVFGCDQPSTLKLDTFHERLQQVNQKGLYIPVPSIELFESLSDIVSPYLRYGGIFTDKSAQEIKNELVQQNSILFERYLLENKLPQNHLSTNTPMMKKI